MKTKFISIAAILLLSVTVAFSQYTEQPKTSFGILGGVNFQTFNGTEDTGSKLEDNMIIGYHAGINVMIPIAPSFYVQPGILFTTKGAKKELTLATRTTSISYIEVPLNFVYRGLLGNGYVLVGFGPYVAYGIMGKVKYTGDFVDLFPNVVNTEYDIEFKDEYATGDILSHNFRALDAGGNIFFGYEMAGGLFMQLNAQLGLLKINPEGNSSQSIKNTGFGLSLGYRF